MINKIKLFFDKDVFLRIVTGIIFIFPFILFIIKGGYLFIFYFLLILSILIHELNNVALNKISFKLRFFLTLIIIFSIFHFIFLHHKNPTIFFYQRYLNLKTLCVQLKTQ